MTIEITIYQHSRPECSFSSVRAAALYLFPEDDAGFLNAVDELQSFHETANRDRDLHAQRTDELAYKIAGDRAYE